MGRVKERGKLPPSAPERNYRWVPIPGDRLPSRWKGTEGVTTRYEVTAAIPWCNTPDELLVAVRLLMKQTVRPFIILIDCGSCPEDHAKVEQFVAENYGIEQHALRMRGVKHPSDFPAIAMDLATSRCQTKWLFCTHADVFLKRRNVIHEFMKLSETEGTPAVGYQISPRPHEGWEGMISHTATLLDLDILLPLGLSWNQRTFCLLHDIKSHEPENTQNNWPDTEHMLNYVLRKHSITPLLVDRDNPIEHNRERNQDHRLDHARSLTSAKLSQSGYYTDAQAWALDAMKEAQERLVKWDRPQPPAPHLEERDPNYTHVEIKPYDNGFPLLVTGCSQGGTSALMRGVVAGLPPEWHIEADDNSPSMEGNFTRVYTDPNFEQTAQEIYDLNIDSYGSKWTMKLPIVSTFFQQEIEAFEWNYLMVVRDPLAKTLSDHRQRGRKELHSAVQDYQELLSIAERASRGVALVSYEELLNRTSQTFEKVFEWMGVDGDIEASVQEIKPIDRRYWKTLA